MNSILATLAIKVSFDLVCPWCLIGKRHLDTAIGMLREQHPEVAVEVTWRSHPLMPEIPKQGLPYAEFYLQRLGTGEAVTSWYAPAPSRSWWPSPRWWCSARSPCFSTPCCTN